MTKEKQTLRMDLEIPLSLKDRVVVVNEGIQLLSDESYGIFIDDLITAMESRLKVLLATEE